MGNNPASSSVKIFTAVPKGALGLRLSLYQIDTSDGGKEAIAGLDTGAYHVDISDPSGQFVDATFDHVGGSFDTASCDTIGLTEPGKSCI